MFEGLCVGGPLDGQWKAAKFPVFTTPEQTPRGEALIRCMSYHHVNWLSGGPALWLADNMDSEVALKRVFDVYARAVNLKYDDVREMVMQSPDRFSVAELLK